MVDISDIKIDTGKPVEKRIKQFLKQIGNPYIFKVGKTRVRVMFSATAPTIQECLLNVIGQI